MLRAGSLLLAASFVLTACGDDSSTDAQSQFTEFEANQVLNAVAAAIESIDAGAPGLAAAIEPVSSTVTCAAGGTAAVSGTRDPAPAVVDFDARVTYTNCATASVTLNGFIDVTATSTIPASGQFRVTWTYVGTVSSKKDGRTRSCTMDVTRVRTTTSSATSTAVNGSICGRHVETSS
jgi:hypothetical protein